MKVVKYTGDSDWRTVRVEDWEQLGVEGQLTVTWNEENARCIPVEDLAEDAVAWCESEPDFAVVELEEPIEEPDPEPENVEVQATDPDGSFV